MPGDALEQRLRNVESGLNTHEAVCAERYNNILLTHADIKNSMAKSDLMLVRIGLSILGGMALILVHQVFYK